MLKSTKRGPKGLAMNFDSVMKRFPSCLNESSPLCFGYILLRGRSGLLSPRLCDFRLVFVPQRLCHSRSSRYNSTPPPLLFSPTESVRRFCLDQPFLTPGNDNSNPQKNSGAQRAVLSRTSSRKIKGLWPYNLFWNIVVKKYASKLVLFKFLIFIYFIITFLL